VSAQADLPLTALPSQAGAVRAPERIPTRSGARVPFPESLGRSGKGGFSDDTGGRVPGVFDTDPAFSRGRGATGAPGAFGAVLKVGEVPP